MKKTIIKTFSVLLVFVMIAFTFAGCDLVAHGTHIFPDGYTCGVGLQPGAPVEYWWVETYDEFAEAIDLLKSHGSTFSDDIVLAYDEELFDLKYGFIMVGNGRQGERIKFGDNPFDRWAYDIKVFVVAFFDDVTIDELVYSNVKNYEAYQIDFGSAYYQVMNDEAFDMDDLNIGAWTSLDEDFPNGRSQYYQEVSYGEQLLFRITTTFYAPYEEEESREFKMTDECINYIINSAKIIELNSEE
ncbi:MAG: hypothetical protein IJX97_00855 [Clostridia bacterium]|nr:hypothetical protein [Clostridia bacterium]